MNVKEKQLQSSKQALFNALTGMAMFTLAATFPELAFAQAGQGVANVAQDLATNVNQGILPVISIGSYVGGTILGISTLLDAKKASENFSQFQGGMPKLATKGVVAAGLFSLPTVMKDVQDSMFNQGGQANFSEAAFQKSTVTN